MPTSAIRVSIAFLLSVLLAVHGKSKNLTVSGSTAAFVVGFGIFSLNCAMGIMLIVFYLSSSKLTYYNTKRKVAQEEFKPKRDYFQVLCNSLWLLGAALSFHFLDYQKEASLVALGVVACCAGDTWASEVGSVLSDSPVLITTFRKVPPGTNGGISLGGTIASILGGLLIGISYYVTSVIFPMDLVALQLLDACLLGISGGFIGSIVDSLLGATVQATYFCVETKKIVKYETPTTKRISGLGLFTNEMVNLVSSGITGAIFILIN